MRIIKIPKGNGKFRTIYVPSAEEKHELNKIVGTLNKKSEKLCGSYVHGFMKKRSPITNAIAHVGHMYTLSMDLKDFFDNVKPEHLKGKLSEEEISKVFIDGAPRQGLPTSPAVANLAAISLDKAILNLIESKKLQVIYTRYADDLCFSYDESTITDILRTEVSRIVSRCGFKLAEGKTMLQSSQQGRRIVTGISVGDDIRVTRATKRKIRAARHQNNKCSLNGLLEWAKLKTPKTKVISLIQSDDTKETLKTLAKNWKLGNIRIDKIPDKGLTEIIDEDTIITGDPVYMLGMSTFTTGWTSCHAQPNGAYRRGAIFWTHLRGTRIGCLLSNKSDIRGGVERRLMKARALIHTMRDGKVYYDRVYGNTQDVDILKQKLEMVGVKSIHTCKDSKVVGHAPANWRAYFDNLNSSVSTASEGRWKGKKVRVVHI